MTVSPGEKCEGCGRRVPHPRTEKSPTSGTLSVRGPADAIPSLKTMVDDMANGPFRQHKYPRFAALEASLKIMSELQPGTLVQIAREMRGQE